MSPNNQGAPLLQLLQHQLETAQTRNNNAEHQNAQGGHIQVPGIGSAISSAYEQLRNAAEYTEEHLLLQRAIRRFYNRIFSFPTKQKTMQTVGDELIVELTQAGYLQNNTYGSHVAQQLTHIAEYWHTTYSQLREANVPRERALDWALDYLSVSSEEVLHPHYELNAITTFAYQHYLNALPRDAFIHDQTETEQYEICLYIGVHKSLLKSDIAIVRHDLMHMYQQHPADMASFIDFNARIDELFIANLTTTLQRSVSKYGAPIRILKRLAETHPDLAQVLGNREQFLALYTEQTKKEYKDIAKRITKGILKSIAFIFITKIVVGLGVEVPYDLIVMGYIAWLPLFINLLVPPLYMASLKLGLHAPSAANADALRDYIDSILYGSDGLPPQPLSVKAKNVSFGAKLLYSIVFFIPFAITVYVLSLLHFNIVQGIIFFVFLSTASFLGFRLARMIRELEIISSQRGFLSTLRDFFYLPFISVGQWISQKYARVNVMAYILDMAIELPLKTILRLFRQWTRFLSDKHDEMY